MDTYFYEIVACVQKLWVDIQIECKFTDQIDHK